MPRSSDSNALDRWAEYQERKWEEEQWRKLEEARQKWFAEGAAAFRTAFADSKEPYASSLMQILVEDEPDVAIFLQESCKADTLYARYPALRVFLRATIEANSRMEIAAGARRFLEELPEHREWKP